MNEDSKKKEIEVKIDTERTELLARENERLKIEKEQREGKTESSLADLKIQAVQKFGRPDLFLQAESKETLNAMLTNYINELAEKSQRNPNPSGSAPLNREQYGTKETNLYSKKYGSHYEMVSDLIEKSHNGNEEAASYLNSLMKAYVFSKKRNLSTPEGFYDPNSPEALQQLDLVRKGDVLTPRDPKDGDIGKVLEKFRLERLLRMKKGSE
jgi:hypothetical protein